MNDEVIKQTEQSIVKLDWEQFEEDMYKLAFEIKQSGMIFKNVLGIPRGGYIVAVRLSHLLKLPLVEQSNSKFTLYCDDIVDSGKTLSRYRKSNLFFVSWILKEDAQYKPEIWVREYKKEQWICFPWEENKNE